MYTYPHVRGKNIDSHWIALVLGLPTNLEVGSLWLNLEKADGASLQVIIGVLLRLGFFRYSIQKDSVGCSFTVFLWRQ